MSLSLPLRSPAAGGPAGAPPAQRTGVSLAEHHVERKTRTAVDASARSRPTGPANVDFADGRQPADRRQRAQAGLAQLRAQPPQLVKPAAQPGLWRHHAAFHAELAAILRPAEAAATSQVDSATGDADGLPREHRVGLTPASRLLITPPALIRAAEAMNGDAILHRYLRHICSGQGMGSAAYMDLLRGLDASRRELTGSDPDAPEPQSVQALQQRAAKLLQKAADGWQMPAAVGGWRLGGVDAAARTARWSSFVQGGTQVVGILLITAGLPPSSMAVALMVIFGAGAQLLSQSVQFPATFKQLLAGQANSQAAAAAAAASLVGEVHRYSSENLENIYRFHRDELTRFQAHLQQHHQGAMNALRA